MPVIAGSVFLGSLLLMALLFMLKAAEVGRPRFAPGLRQFFDDGALYIKEILLWIAVRGSRIPPTLALLVRYGIHQGALSAARISRMIERAAHDLADLVSHKHRFERRETKSQYLKDVGEHPMRTREDESEV